jgi:zinc/manganese transport system substrate-binding protein
VKIAAAAAITAALTLLGTACGSDSGRDGAEVAATTGILADITREVAGDDAEVVQVIPESSSPHDFQLSAQDRADIEDSSLLVHNGSGLEEGVPVDEIDVPQFALADNAGETLGADGEPDPHVWMDPTRVAAAVPALAEALAEADPENADGYRMRARRYASELETLDGEVSKELAAVPPDARKLVTSHDALSYFADRYGFEVIATAFPATGAEGEASAAAIRDVEEAVERAGVPAVFAESEDDPEVLELVSDATGVEVVDDLLVESPGDSGSYTEMLRHDAELIAGSLAPE